MVSIPERNWSVSLRVLGVVGREGIGVTDLEITPFSLLSLTSGHYVRGQARNNVADIDNILFTPSFQDIVGVGGGDEVKMTRRCPLRWGLKQSDEQPECCGGVVCDIHTSRETFIKPKHIIQIYSKLSIHYP